MKQIAIIWILIFLLPPTLFSQKNGILSEKTLKRQHYQPLPAEMCAVTFNPSGWNDNFFIDVSDRHYFGAIQDSLQLIPDQMPMFPDGFDGLHFFVYFNLKYPDDAFRKKISGRVIMSVDLDEKGDVSNIKVIKSEYPSFGTEATEVLNDLPKLYPAIKNGVFVPVRLYLPIKFSINQ